MENDGFRAIHFNAWEDDFCDDPFVAIIGQLHDFLKRKGIKGLADNIRKAAKPLLIQGALSTLHKVSGVNLDKILKQFADKTFDEYSRQGEKRMNSRQHCENYKEIELLKEYRTRLIADLVTGKLDVREAAFKLPEVPDELSFSDKVDDLTRMKTFEDHAY